MTRPFLRVALLIVATASAANAQARWRLVEDLRLGGEEAGPALFEYVKSIEADARGRILVYDRNTQDIRMFGPDGKHIRTIGRKGAGPGEMRDAEGISIARDGRIYVRDAANARMSAFSAEGEFEKSTVMKYCMSQGAWNPRPDRAGRLLDIDCIIPATRTAGRAPDYALVAYRTDLSGVDTLGARPECGSRELNDAGTWITRYSRGGRSGMMMRSIPWAAHSGFALGDGGDLWCMPNTSRYEVLRLRAGAKDTLRVARDLPRVPVTDAERDSIIGVFEAKGPTGLDFSRIPKEKPAIERLIVDDRGRLWVQRSNADRAIEFDIFTPDGRLTATAHLGVVKTSTYTPFIVRGDNVYAVVLDEDDVQHVVRYRIRR